MKSAVNERAWELLRRAEQEIVEQKQKYNVLLEDFNYNIGLLKQRDLELDRQEAIMQEQQESIKKFAGFDEIKQNLVLTQQQLQAVTQNYNSLKIDYKSQLTKQTDTSQQLEKLRAEEEKLIFENDIMRKQVSEFQKQHKEGNYQLQQLNEQLTSNIKEQIQAKTTNEMLVKQVALLEEDREGLKMKLESVQEKSSNMREQGQELLLDNKKLSDEYLNIRRKYDAMLQDKEKTEETLEQLLNRYKTDVTELKKSLKQSQLQLNQEQNKNHESAEQLNSMTRDNILQKQNFERLLEQGDKQNSILQNDIRQLKDQISFLDKEYVAKLSRTQADASLERSELKEVLKNTQIELQRLRIENQKINEQNNDLKELIPDLKHQIQDSRGSQLQSTVSKLRAELETQNMALQKVQTDLQLKNEVIQQMKQIIDTKEQDIKQLIQKHDRVLKEKDQIILAKESEANEYKTRLISNKPGTSVEREVIEKLRSKLVETAAQLKEFAEENDDKEQQVTVLKQQIADYQSEISRLKRELQRVDKQNASEVVQQITKRTQEAESQLLDHSALKGEIADILKDAGM